MTWKEVLCGRDIGLQVWSRQIYSRDLYSLFSNKRRTSTTIMSILHNFHLEFYGDQCLTLELISLYYKALSKSKSEDEIIPAWL
mmetsp:Transcript_20911/g.29331  ORF Transcript_20911/g.29331 Transcript_20911/m.29331 type:complete len:84 (-) Transcript_20911:103-354(-)